MLVAVGVESEGQLPFAGLYQLLRPVLRTVQPQLRPAHRRPLRRFHAEKLLGTDYGAAAIGIDAAQIKGVLPLPLSALHSTLPVFKNPANKHRAVSLTAEQFHYSLGNALSEEESNELYDHWTIPAPGPRPSPSPR